MAKTLTERDIKEPLVYLAHFDTETMIYDYQTGLPISEPNVEESPQTTSAPASTPDPDESPNATPSPSDDDIITVEIG